MKEKIIGAIFPMPLNSIENILYKDKDIFVKYVARSPSKKSKIRIKKGVVIYLYASGGNRKVFGEAKVSDIYFMTLADILLNFKGRTFLSSKELRTYCGSRTDKTAMVLKLNKIRRYKQEKKTKKPINMGGLYLTKDSIKEIFV